MAPPIPNQAGQVKHELIVSRLAHRLGLRQETVWARFAELKTERRRKQQENPQPTSRPTAAVVNVPNNTPSKTPMPKAGPAAEAEKYLLQMLLADPILVAVCREKVTLESIIHTGLRRILSELYAMHDAGQPPDFDGLRVRLLDRVDLVDASTRLQFVGRVMPDRLQHLQKVFNFFDELQHEREKKLLKDKLSATDVNDDDAIELLRKLQKKPDPKPGDK